MGNLPGWVIPVIILVIVVLAILIIVGVVSSRRRRARQEEIDRQRAAELRTEAQKDQVGVKEREIQARETELEADKAKVEAERRDQTAQEQRQDADRARADVDDRLRQADELDPDVATKKSGARQDADAPLDGTAARDAGDAEPRADDRRAPGHGAGVAAGAAGAGVAGAGAAGAGADASHEEHVDRTDRTDRTEQSAGTDGATARRAAAPQERADDRPRDARTADAAPREEVVNPDVNRAGPRDEHTTRPDAHTENAPQPGAHAEHTVQPDARSERSTQSAPREARAAQPGAAPRDQRIPDDAPETVETADGGRVQGRHEDGTRGSHRAPAEGGHAAAAGGAGAAAGAGVASEHREDALAGTQREPRPAEQTEGRHRDARPVDGDAAREDARAVDGGAARRAQPVEDDAAAPATHTSRTADRQSGDADGHVLSEDEIDARATASGPGTDRRNAAPTAGDTAPWSRDAYEDPRSAVTPAESQSPDDGRAPRSLDETDGRTPRPEDHAEESTSRPGDVSDPFSVSESHVRRARRPREGELDDGIEDTERGL